MLTSNVKPAVLSLLIGMLFTVTACSSVEKNNSGSEKTLKASLKTECKRGLIRPPGVSRCMVIGDILAGNIKFRAPRGKCPDRWEKHTQNGFCLPAYHLVACGIDTFSCGNERRDTSRTVKGEPKCKDGTIVVTGQAPSFDHEAGLYLGTTTVLACGPITKNEPL